MILTAVPVFLLTKLFVVILGRVSDCSEKEELVGKKKRKIFFLIKI